MLLILKSLTVISFAEKTADFASEKISDRIKAMGKDDTIPVDFYAENLDYRKDENLLIGEGSVDIQYRGMSLQADRAEYNLETGNVKATGNVVVEDGSSVLFCESMDLNIKTQIGVIYNGELFLEPTYYLTGVEIRRLGVDKYKIINGYYTACQKPVPEWSIKTSEATAEVEGMLHAKDASFAIKKVPVFYFPHLLVPIKTKRATGLLFPKIGSSTRNGFRWYQPFFWALTDYADATFNIDYQGKRGVGAEGNFRYVIDEESSGAVNGYIIDTRSGYSNESGTTGKKARWNFFAFHQQSFPENLRMILKVDLRSDENFNRDFKETFEERTKQSDIKSDSYFSLTKTWEKNAFLLNISGYEDRIKSQAVDPEGSREASIESIYQHLPELKFISIAQPVFGRNGIFKDFEKLSELMPFQFHLEASFASLKSSKDTNDYTFDGDTKNSFITERLDIHPSILLPLSYKNFMTLTPAIGIRETYYTHRLQSSRNRSEEFQGKADSTGKRTDFSGDSALSRELFDFSLRFDAPRIYKTLGFNFLDISKLKHVIEPVVEYQYIPSVDQSTIIQTDSLDYIKGREFLSYSITNRFYAKFKDAGNGNETAREVATIKISQYYDFMKDKKSTRDRIVREGRFGNKILSQSRVDVQKKAFSDLNFDLELYPYKYLVFNLNSFFDPTDGALDRFIGNINFEREFFRTKLNASLSMRWTDPEKNQALDWYEPDYNPSSRIQTPLRNTFTTLKLDLNIPNGWELGYLGRFYSSEQSLDSDLFSLSQREFAIRTKYSSQCWSVEALYGVREYFREGHSKMTFDDEIRNDQFFWLVIELESLGAIGPLSL